MMVHKISKNKLKIALSDNEVMAYFGTYEQIASMSKSVKLKMSILLEEVLADYGLASGNQKILIDIHAINNGGCDILVTVVEKREPTRRQKSEAHLLEFSDSESMISGIMSLYHNHKFKNSVSYLYKMPKTYRLILKASLYQDVRLHMNEFCVRQSDFPYEMAYTEEYGKLLISGNAIKTFGSAFSKSF